MENINIQPSYMINKYGNTVTVINGDNTIETKAFIQPLKRKHTMYMSAVEKRILNDAEQKGYQLYIGKPNIPISTSSILTYKNKKYSIINHEDQILNNKVIYIWAILKPKEKN